MNAIHNVLCSSGWWAARVERELLPWGLHGVELGDDVLEIGPGFGATTRVLADQRRSAAPGRRLNVVELEPRYCEKLRAVLGDQVEVTQGDVTDLPYEEGRFTSAICFTMLHHIPSARLQDQAFAEIARVLAPGGAFAGTDSIGNGRVFKLIHVGDTLNLLDPGTLPERLRAAGFADVEVDTGSRSLRFRARKPR